MDVRSSRARGASTPGLLSVRSDRSRHRRLSPEVVPDRSSLTTHVIDQALASPGAGTCVPGSMTSVQGSCDRARAHI